MKFDFCIGNPPYQESRDDTKDMPVYHDFMNAAYTVADKVELITPARFLFNAGSTPKSWNRKMLDDEHFKILNYTADGSDIFPNTDIKGGVAIHYHDMTENYEPIKVFAAFSELNSIRNKVVDTDDFVGLDSIVYSESAWRISDAFRQEKPNEISRLGKSASRFFASNVFEILSSNVLYDKKPNDGKEYVGLYGRYKGQRVYKWIDANYVNAPDNKDKYKVFVPKSNGCGAVGEPLSTPVIGQPIIGHTQTFISIGKFNTESEAINALKYIKGKFARVCLGMLKITQDNKKDTWRCVPLQDFTSNSDIDWSQSIADIDRQLYRKYGLTQEEIDFIETHVKEMR